MMYRVTRTVSDLPNIASRGDVIITLQGEPTPWVFDGSHWNPIYGHSKTCEPYYVECSYCNSWVDTRNHTNCPNCSAPLKRDCLNSY